ncbi:MAG: BlaI/MecI/CopY family transcriptional regulator [Oscillospiraceae bacterium]|nr:BlaI/MecI/CopY family transcriptional regulator [Oscillospiraceae bacterium]
MSTYKKLPDAEFEIMKIVWANEPPITTHIIMEQLGASKGWKAQTVITLMLRLVERGFLRTEKIGRDRVYFPLVAKEDYTRFETRNFLKQYHDNSLLGLVSTLYGDKTLSDQETEDLRRWLRNQGE